MESGRDVSKEAVFYYDIVSCARDEIKRPLKEYYYPNGLIYKFFTDEQQKKVIKKYLQSFSGISKEYQLRKMQEPYQGISRKYLLFHVEYSQ
ncbi:unnamed protein product, partial [marine sediment metagenome]